MLLVANHIKALGHPLTGEVEYNGAKFFFIINPDDNVIEFHQPCYS